MGNRTDRRWQKGPTRLRVREDSTLYRKCSTEKRGYSTRALAFDVAETMMDCGFVAPGCHVVPYRCPECGEWHVANRRVRFRPEPGVK